MKISTLLACVLAQYLAIVQSTPVSNRSTSKNLSIDVDTVEHIEDTSSPDSPRSFGSSKQRPPTPGMTGNRIIAIGDLHGDFDKFKRILLGTHLIDENEDWTAKEGTKLILTGDITDRGPDAKRIFELIRKLEVKAKSTRNCEVTMVLGNHEIMNMEGNTKYVSDEENNSYGGKLEREEEFSVSHEFGMWLRSMPIVKNVQGTIFVHGGISDFWAKKIKAMGGIDQLNDQVEKMLRDGKWTDPMLNPGHDGVGKTPDAGPLWYRGYASSKDCQEIDTVLNRLGVKRMVMGHSIMKDGLIHSKCNGKILLIDIGISSYYDKHYKPTPPNIRNHVVLPRCGALEIDSVGNVKALYCTNKNEMAALRLDVKNDEFSM